MCVCVCVCVCLCECALYLHTYVPTLFPLLFLIIDDKAKLDMDTDVQFQKKFLAGECMHCVYSIIIMPTFCTGP